MRGPVFLISETKSPNRVRMMPANAIGVILSCRINTAAMTAITGTR
ncbi:MAG: hypothetical protein V8T87_02970 [Victivallales bacterium]